MGNVWNKDLFNDIPFTDLEEEYEEIKRLNKIITELKELQEELMNENQGYRDATDRMNEYISNYELAIRQFNNRNSN